MNNLKPHQCCSSHSSHKLSHSSFSAAFSVWGAVPGWGRALGQDTSPCSEHHSSPSSQTSQLCPNFTFPLSQLTTSHFKGTGSRETISSLFFSKYSFLFPPNFLTSCDLCVEQAVENSPAFICKHVQLKKEEK